MTIENPIPEEDLAKELFEALNVPLRDLLNALQRGRAPGSGRVNFADALALAIARAASYASSPGVSRSN